MTNEIIFKLHYCIKGEQKEKDLKIYFVSNWFHQEFKKLIDLSSMLYSKMMILQNNIMQIDTLRIDQPERYKDLIKTYEMENKSLVKEIEGKGAVDFLPMQLELVKEILEGNKIDFEDLHNKDFWNRNVETQEIMNLLKACEEKDYPKKKAVAQVTK